MFLCNIFVFRVVIEVCKYLEAETNIYTYVKYINLISSFCMSKRTIEVGKIHQGYVLIFFQAFIAPLILNEFSSHRNAKCDWQTAVP